MTRRSLAALLAVAFGLACTEDPTAPGQCPDYCPPGNIVLIDTVLTSAIVRDSAFRGYLFPTEAALLIATNVPGVIDSRPVMRFQPLGTTLTYGADTTHYPILGTDSVRYELTLFRRDTSAGNVRVGVYRLPLTLDSNSTFAGLAGSFTDSLIRTINVDSLIASTTKRDTVTGDSVVVVDSTMVRLLVHLDSVEARFVAADSGRTAFGVRVQADTATSLVLGSNESGNPPLLTWFFRVDSAGTTAHSIRALAPDFDSYVFNPQSAAVDSTLVVGGMPSTRSVLRIALPRWLRDSTQILRATLMLLPAVAAQGAPLDSFTIVAHAVAVDLGGKSPLIASSDIRDSSFFGVGSVLIGSTDTVRIEITRILRRWAADTTAPNTLVLRSGSEGVVLTEIRLQPSRHPTLRPVLHVTYTAPFPFGVP